jgi:hypothetical protein
MKTPEQLKQEFQLSKAEVLEQANNLIENFIEPKIVEAVKEYKNHTAIRLTRQTFTGGLVSIPTHKYDKPTPLGNHLVKKCISILSDNGYDAYVDESNDINTYLQITWD